MVRDRQASARLPPPVAVVKAAECPIFEGQDFITEPFAEPAAAPDPPAAPDEPVGGRQLPQQPNRRERGWRKYQRNGDGHGRPGKPNRGASLPCARPRDVPPPAPWDSPTRSPGRTSPTYSPLDAPPEAEMEDELARASPRLGPPRLAREEPQLGSARFEPVRTQNLGSTAPGRFINATPDQSVRDGFEGRQEARFGCHARNEQDLHSIHERTKNELELTKRRCAELEHLSFQGASSDNADLRMQVSMLSEKVEVLRQEKHEAEEATRASQEELQRLINERADLHQSLTGQSTSPLGGGGVVVGLTVHNINYSRLHDTPQLVDAFRFQIRRAIADDAVHCGEAGVLPEHVTVNPFIKGSLAHEVWVEAVVDTSSSGVEPGLLARKLGQSQSLARALAIHIESIGNIACARQAAIGVHGITVSCRRGDELDSRCRQLLAGHDTLKRSHDALQGTQHGLLSCNDKLRKELDTLRKQHAEELCLREEAHAQLDCHKQEMDSRMQEEADRRIKDRNHLAQAASSKDNLKKLVAELMGLVDELQEKYVAQTRHYDALAKAIRKHQLSHAQDVQVAMELAESQHQFLDNLRQHLAQARSKNEMKDWDLKNSRDTLEHFESETHKLLHENANAAESLRNHNFEARKRDVDENSRQQQLARITREKQVSRHLRHRMRNNPNISQAMAAALEGRQVQKVSGVDPKNPRPMSKPRLGYRMLKVVINDDKKGVPFMQLAWAKPPYTTFVQKSTCDLSRVVVLGYGYSARAPMLLPEAEARVERCVSVYTPRRSFDFVFETEADAEVFLLVISRLSYRIQGWPVSGHIPTHAKFQSAKGWCKVQRRCRDKQSTMLKSTLESVHASLATAVAKGSLGLRLAQQQRADASAGLNQVPMGVADVQMNFRPSGHGSQDLSLSTSPLGSEGNLANYGTIGNMSPGGTSMNQLDVLPGNRPNAALPPTLN